jgi:glycosyltransferase involved in cell wall biosynthesis
MTIQKIIVSLVMPVHNEEDIIKEVVLSVHEKMENEFGKRFEIICSENGSSDKTLSILRDIESEYPKVRVVSSDDPNIGKATRKGYLSAKGEYLTNASVDWYDVDFIKSALPLLKKYDIVVGTKSKAGYDQRPMFRRIVSRGYNLALKSLFGLKVTDTHSLTVYKRKKVLPIIKMAVMGKSVFSSEVIIRAQNCGLRITEKDLMVREERKRKKSIIARTIRGFFDLIGLRIVLWKEDSKK